MFGCNFIYLRNTSLCHKLFGQTKITRLLLYKKVNNTFLENFQPESRPSSTAPPTRLSPVWRRHGSRTTSRSTTSSPTGSRSRPRRTTSPSSWWTVWPMTLDNTPAGSQGQGERASPAPLNSRFINVRNEELKSFSMRVIKEHEMFLTRPLSLERVNNNERCKIVNKLIQIY